MVYYVYLYGKCKNCKNPYSFNLKRKQLKTIMYYYLNLYNY